VKKVKKGIERNLFSLNSLFSLRCVTVLASLETFFMMKKGKKVSVCLPAAVV